MDVSWPLVGRQAELEALVADISEARGGVVLAGAAGVGKTRLAREALVRVHAVGRDVEWVAATRAAASPSNSPSSQAKNSSSSII
mgnify:CR=1 FL=1